MVCNWEKKRRRKNQKVKKSKKQKKGGTQQRSTSFQVIPLDDCLASVLLFHRLSCPSEHSPHRSRGDSGGVITIQILSILLTPFNSSQSPAKYNPKSFNLTQFGLFCRFCYSGRPLPSSLKRNLALSCLRALQVSTRARTSYSSPCKLFLIFSSWASTSHFLL